MESYLRSDLACECSEIAERNAKGVSTEIFRKGGFEFHKTSVETEEAEARTGKPRGNYLTLFCGKLRFLGKREKEKLALLLAEELRTMAEHMTGKRVGSDFGVFVGGLGNGELTVDAIGPKTVSLLTATRHLRDCDGELYHALGCSSLSAFAPGVMGKTGIETLEILRGTVGTTKPDIAVIIDALAARSCDRLATTVQLSDTGIVPGSGVGNHRNAITGETLGVPVLAVGVPTVVDSATLVYDALNTANITQIDDSLRKVLENGKSFFVSPKESDLIVGEICALLARSIELAFLGDLTL
jgi:spore protease